MSINVLNHKRCRENESRDLRELGSRRRVVLGGGGSAGWRACARRRSVVSFGTSDLPSSSGVPSGDLSHMASVLLSRLLQLGHITGRFLHQFR